MTILQSQKPTYDELMAQVAALKAKQVASNKISFKVSENKGTLSVYGLGRFPVSLYASQWERLIAAADDIKAFIAANASTLTRKA